LEEAPDDRARHRALVRALAQVGALDEAEAAARAWLGRDALDAEALTYLADAIGRSGRRDEATRVQQGIVDLAPDDLVLHARMANAFARAGDLERECAHRVTLAELSATDARASASAIRCARALGHGALSTALLELAGAQRSAVEALLLSSRDDPRRPQGQLVLRASWEAPVDLDLSIITPQGTRVSWLGGRTTVFAEDAQARGNETLGLTRASLGSYVVELARVSPDDTREVRGRVEVESFGAREVFPFTLSEGRLRVARLDVRRERQKLLVPIRGALGGSR
jgi:tetratricopeptide (TPR) repeat protein